MQDSIEDLAAAVAKIPKQELQKMATDQTATLASLADKGYLSADTAEKLGEEFLKLPLSAFMQAAQSGTAAQSYETIGDFVTAMEAASPEAGKMVENIPEKYREEILATSMQQRPSVNLAEIGRIIILLIIMIGASALIMYIQGFIMSGVAQRLSYRFRKDIDTKINKLPLSFYDKTTHGEVMSFITNDVDTISTTLNQSLSQILTSVVTVFGVLFMMIKISWILTCLLYASPSPRDS